jgi:hypothetical protein
MAALKKPDFQKTAKAGAFSGKTRTDIVFLKIEKGLPFILGDTANGKKVYGKSFNENEFQLTYAESNSEKSPRKFKTISITKVFKDEDFGGGGSRAKQADNTPITESGCAYYMSLVFNIIKRELKEEDCTDENLEKAKDYVKATTSLKDFKEKGPQDWFDEKVYMNTANAVYKEYKGKLQGTVYCHRGSSFMSSLYEAKKKALSVDQKEDRIAPGSFNDDKWNPGDIWLSSFPMSSQPLAESITWAEMNQKVLEYAGATTSVKTTKLLGVSLKKLAPSGGKVDSYNLAKRKHNVSVQFKSFKFGKTGDFFSSMDIYLKFSVAEVQLRAFNTTSAWQGEIKGAIAAGGKIGGGNLNYYLEKHAMKSIGYPNENSKKGVAWKEMKYSEVDMTKMYDLYVKFNSFQSGKTFPIVSYTEFIQRADKKGKGFIFSKNMCLMFMNTFMETSPANRNKISTEIVRYAASNTDISSFFIKVF